MILVLVCLRSPIVLGYQLTYSGFHLAHLVGLTSRSMEIYLLSIMCVRILSIKPATLIFSSGVLATNLSMTDAMKIYPTNSSLLVVPFHSPPESGDGLHAAGSETL